MYAAAVGGGLYVFRYSPLGVCDATTVTPVPVGVAEGGGGGSEDERATPGDLANVVRAAAARAV